MAPPRTGENRTCPICGSEFYAVPSDDRRGHRRTYCSMTCRAEAYRGEGNPKWRGGTFVTASGYRMIHLPGHPHSDKAGYYEEHRHIVERRIGRTLEPTECVHHLNHDRLDNRPENLQLMESWAEHQIAHAEYRNEPCGTCAAPVRRSKAHRRKWQRVFCSRSCAAAAGSAANAAKAGAR